MLRAPVPTHAFLVIDPTVRVEPHDGIGGAMSLGRRFGAELLHGAARDRYCRRCRMVRFSEGGRTEKSKGDDQGREEANEHS